MISKDRWSMSTWYQDVIVEPVLRDHLGEGVAQGINLYIYIYISVEPVLGQVVSEHRISSSWNQDHEVVGIKTAPLCSISPLRMQMYDMMEKMVHQHLKQQRIILRALCHCSVVISADITG